MTQLRFSKMHGTGNDFLVLDGINHLLPNNLSELAKKLSHRRFGVGFDQMLVIRPSQGESADFKMEIINADGSQVEMCGNGIRCIAKYIHDHNLSPKTELVIETLAGLIRPKLQGGLVEVDMGEPELEATKIPIQLEGKVLEHPLKIKDKTFQLTGVSMGNPHAVIFVDSVENFPVSEWGPLIEKHELFPNRVNVEFIEVTSPTQLKMRVWERGAGETYACGTGACASLVAAVLTGRSKREATLHLKGGDLKICWSENNNRVYMTGPAEEVFEGELLIQ